MKVIVIGCTHAGTAAILNLKKEHPEIEITVYERNDNISFLSCGIALYVGGVVKDPQGLFYCSPEKLDEIGVTTKMKHDVVDIDFQSKKVRVRNLNSQGEMDDAYDKLIITTGSWPVFPNIPGIKLKNILVSKNYEHSNNIIAAAKKAETITVVGADILGLNWLKPFARKGKKFHC
jgi:NADPH-dependent 2,4-dienoyl-CoA reductase/sulfur reductase-like enzyme